MELDKIRKDIDHLDQEIITLLNKRIELALRTKHFKSDIRDQERESQIIDRLKTYSKAFPLLAPETVESFYRAVMEDSRSKQSQDRMLMGFQGEHGAFGEVAARIYDDSAIPIPCPEFSDVFKDVARGVLDRGIVPVENTLGGAITQVNELLITTPLSIVGAVSLPINHCLLTLPETNYRELKVIVSHPQALSQCRDFIDRHKLESRPYYDTAGAARMLSRSRPKLTGVIASQLCSRLYGLEIIKENIQDHSSNHTRFLILSREERLESGNKCSILFTTPHRAGTLFTVLKIFADEKINLTRIESIPDRNDPGRSIFFLDFLLEEAAPSLDALLDKVKSKTHILKCLGRYSEEVIR